VLVAERRSTVDNPWDDPTFVALYQEDVAAEERGDIDDGVTAEEFAARYEQYLPRR